MEKVNKFRYFLQKAILLGICKRMEQISQVRILYNYIIRTELLGWDCNNQRNTWRIAMGITVYRLFSSYGAKLRWVAQMLLTWKSTLKAKRLKVNVNKAKVMFGGKCEICTTVEFAVIVSAVTQSCAQHVVNLYTREIVVLKFYDFVCSVCSRGVLRGQNTRAPK